MRDRRGNRNRRKVYKERNKKKISNFKRDAQIHTKVQCKLADCTLLPIVSICVCVCACRACACTCACACVRACVSIYLYVYIYLCTYITAAYFRHCSLISTYYMPRVQHADIHGKYHVPYHEIAYQVCIIEWYVRISLHTNAHVTYMYILGGNFYILYIPV